MSPVTDVAYGLPISATEGYMNIKKNVDSVVSGRDLVPPLFLSITGLFLICLNKAHHSANKSAVSRKKHWGEPNLLDSLPTFF